MKHKSCFPSLIIDLGVDVLVCVLMCVCVCVSQCGNVSKCDSEKMWVYPSAATILSTVWQLLFVHVRMCVYVGVYSWCTLESSWRGESEG